MLIPSDLAQNAADMLSMNEYTSAPVETQEQPVLCDSEAFQRDVTAWPVDAPKPPFAVGSVYTFADIWGRERTALIYTEQHARVDGCWWHVSELPEDAEFDRTFTPDPTLAADARRFAREVANSQGWS